MNPFNKRTMLSALTLLLILAPMLAYTPSANVEAGHRISGQDFSTDEAYLTTVLTTPIVLTVLGVLSLVILNIALCCRNCFKCCRCEPNDHHTEKGHDHDSLSQRMSYINHQKFMVFIVEMVLCACVMLADMFCFYGYTGIVAGGEDLNDALDLINQLLTSAVDGAKAIKAQTVTMNSLAVLSQETTCPPNGSSSLTAAYTGLKILIAATGTAMDAVVNAMGPIQENVATNKNFINDTLIAYADVFVFLVFSFAFVSVCLFVIFRLLRSTCGTKIAISWGMLTFLILLLVCLPFMIFSSIFGDFCMAPSANAVKNAPADIQEKLRFYSTCAAGLEDVVGDNLKTGKDKLAEIISTITTQMLGYCDGTAGPPSRSPVELNKIDNIQTALTLNLDKIITAASCVKVQEIWFKIVNDALCTNFYSGIYSLWVSQFVTSFFLFLLIVQASISYHYFAKSSVYVSTEGAIELPEKGSNPSDVKENLAEEMQKTNDYGDSEA